ncbi:hypothetical protein KCP73_26095 [Salmonella enterica subsp. enterica]|nr:hypothetical protein KCP73_26095 [Salmonella enterica subsp. enterica]
MAFAFMTEELTAPATQPTAPNTNKVDSAPAPCFMRYRFVHTVEIASVANIGEQEPSRRDAM